MDVPATMANLRLNAFSLMFLMLLAPLAGCFGEDGSDAITVKSLEVVEADSLLGGSWQKITLVANDDLAVYLPYFVQDPGSLRAQNGTVLDMRADDTVSVDILFPPRNADVVFFLGDYGRMNWPIRAADESWMAWLNDSSEGSSIQVIDNEDEGGLWPWLVAGNDTGGEVTPLYRQGGGMLAGVVLASVPRARKAGGGAGPRAQQAEQAPYTYSQY